MAGTQPTIDTAGRTLLEDVRPAASPTPMPVLLVVRRRVDARLRSFLGWVLRAHADDLRVVVVTTEPRKRLDYHLLGPNVLWLVPSALEWTAADAARAAGAEIRRLEGVHGSVVVGIAPARLGRLPNVAQAVHRAGRAAPDRWFRADGWVFAAAKDAERLVDEHAGSHVLWRPYVRRLGGPAVLSTGFVALTVLIELLYPWPLKVLVDFLSGSATAPRWITSIAGDGPIAVAAVLAAASLLLVGADAMTSYGSTVVAGRATEHLAGDMRVSVFSRITHLPLDFFDRFPSGELMTRLTGDVGRVQGTTVQVLTSLLPDVLRLVGILGVLLALDPLLAMVGLAALPLLALTVSARRRRTKVLQRRSRALQGQLSSTANELIRNVRLIRAFGAEGEAIDRYRSEIDQAVDAEVTALQNSARFSPIADMTLAVVSGIVMLIGVQRVVDERLTVGALLVVFSYLSSLYGPARSLAGLGQLLSRTAASRERLADVFDEALPPERVHAVRPLGMSQPSQNTPIRGELEMSAVGFSYRPGVPVLDGTDLLVPPGSHVCIVGPSGTGKTTLLHLALRLHEVDSGVVTLDGFDLRDLPLSVLRNRIALVPQDSWIMDASMRDNLTVGTEGTSDEDIAEAIALTNLASVVNGLPDGLDTKLGEGGIRISGGERKRIALARALLRRPEILLLDEPTSGLDAENEAQVLTVIAGIASPRSVLTVTHSPLVASVADVVYELRDRRLHLRPIAGRMPEATIRPTDKQRR